jgi:CheY-like chemotaxis protein
MSNDPNPRTAEGSKAPVLVVEDHADTRAMVETLLRLEGFPVVTAENGRRGLERLQEVRPCLILLDLSMPVMDGWQFRRAQRRLPDVEEVPVLLLTANPDPARAVAELGAAGVIPKPVDIDQLLAVVREHCGFEP